MFSCVVQDSPVPDPSKASTGREGLRDLGALSQPAAARRERSCPAPGGGSGPVTDVTFFFWPLPLPLWGFTIVYFTSGVLAARE